ncbi:MAG: hypothetical protein ACQETH_13910 [Candidatus Rifleibacteriota bacterium]
MTTTIAIRREDKNIWEKRVALTPEAIKKLSSEKLRFVVQPSKIRIYKDSDYEAAGALIKEDVSDADLLIGVKEMPMSIFKPGGAYMFFSHTIKAQEHNMEMLKKLVELKASLIDFECITDENNRRLVFFGRYAGIAGMIDSFYTLGQRLLVEGYETIFSRVKMSYQYPDLATAKAALKELADEFSSRGAGDFDQPMIFGFAGYGNVSEGAQEIFDIFPHREISPADLLKLDKSKLAKNELIKVVFREQDTVENKNQDVDRFEKQNYFDYPEQYQSRFYKYLPHLTCLINCIFWAKDSPRLLTLKECDKLFRTEDNRLKVIGDITCDLHGSIECTTLATEPDDPSYVYDIDDKKIKMGFKGNGPAIMAVDNLPCEVARDASDAFSSALSRFVPYFADFNPEANFEDLQLPEPVKKAIILWKGQFTENFRFMREFIKE